MVVEIHGGVRRHQCLRAGSGGSVRAASTAATWQRLWNGASAVVEDDGMLQKKVIA